jgi:hypothetical protein
MRHEPDLAALVGALTRYVRTNPHAVDTAEGIHRWWLPSEIECTPAAVVHALDWMEEHELIEVNTAADGRRRFRRRGSDEQLAALLRQLASGQTLP